MAPALRMTRTIIETLKVFFHQCRRLVRGFGEESSTKLLVRMEGQHGRRGGEEVLRALQLSTMASNIFPPKDVVHKANTASAWPCNFHL